MKGLPTHQHTFSDLKFAALNLYNKKSVDRNGDVIPMKTVERVVCSWINCFDRNSC